MPSTFLLRSLAPAVVPVVFPFSDDFNRADGLLTAGNPQWVTRTPTLAPNQHSVQANTLVKNTSTSGPVLHQCGTNTMQVKARIKQSGFGSQQLIVASDANYDEYVFLSVSNSVNGEVRSIKGGTRTYAVTFPSFPGDATYAVAYRPQTATSAKIDVYMNDSLVATFDDPVLLSGTFGGVIANTQGDFAGQNFMDDTAMTVSTVAMNLLFTDDFNRADSTTNPGPYQVLRFTAATAGEVGISNNAYYQSSGADGSNIFALRDLGSSNGSVSVTLTQALAQGQGVVARTNASTQINGASGVTLSVGASNILNLLELGIAQYSTGHTVVVGDRITLEMSGTTARVLVNGVLVFTQTVSAPVADQVKWGLNTTRVSAARLDDLSLS